MMRNGLGSVVKRNNKRNNNKETAPAPPAASTASAATATATSLVPQGAPKQLLAPDTSNGNNNHNGATQRKTKPTPEEAVLTAKNYRLAKELSELRVRHREECKNVTKLTMENMNLASRCREAISHAAMLKKELAAQQRRTAEAVALQQQQQRQSELVKTVIVNAAHAAAASAATSSSSSYATKTAAADTVAAVPLSSSAVESNKVVAVVSTTTTPTPPSSATATPTNGTSPLNTPVAGLTVIASSPAPVVAAPTAMGSTIGGSSKKNLNVDVAAEMEIMDLIVAAHTPTASASSSPVPPRHFVPLAPALPPVHDNTDANDNDDDKGNVMMGAETILSIKPIKTASTGTATSSSYTPPESPKMSVFEESALAAEDDEDDDSEPDVEVYQELNEPDITDLKPSSPTVVTSIAAGRHVLRKTTTPPTLDSAAAEMAEIMLGSDSSPGQTCGTSVSPFNAGAIKKENYNEEYPGDISVVRTNTGRRSLGDFKEIDDETSVQSGTSSQVAAAFERKQAAAEDKSTMSSIDAFEASFQTNFPDSFSPRDSIVEEKKTSESGIYNPFFPSPAKKSPRTENASTGSSERPWANNARDRPSVASRRMEGRRNSGKSPVNGQASPSPKAGTPTASPAPPSKLKAAVDLPIKVPFSTSLSPVAKRYPSPISRPMPSSPAIQHYSPTTPQPVPSPRNTVKAFRTPPPLAGSRTPSPERSSEQPTRPEKTGYDAARSRYEKALKPRSVPGHKFKEIDSSDSLAGDLLKLSPADVLLKLSSTEPKTATVPNASQQPSVRDRAAIFSETSPRTQEKAVVFRGSRVAQAADGDDGDIPMNSTLSAKKAERPSRGSTPSPVGNMGNGSERSRVSTSSPVGNTMGNGSERSRVSTLSPVGNTMGNGSEHSSSGSVNEIDEARTRLRPWDSASASAGQLKEEREFDQSQIDATPSPAASRFTLSGKHRRTVKESPPDEHISARYRPGEAFRPKPDSAGIGPQ